MPVPMSLRHLAFQTRSGDDPEETFTSSAFQRQVSDLGSCTRRGLNSHCSAKADLGFLVYLRQQCSSNLPVSLRHFTTDNFGDDNQNDQKKTPRLSLGTGGLTAALRGRPMSGHVRFGASLRMPIRRPMRFSLLSPVSCCLPGHVGRDKVNVRIVSDSRPLISGPSVDRSSRPPCRCVAGNQPLQVPPDRDVPVCP